ncbi:hypothetical protein MANES_10G076074v8 [Manihot esculenta]|uniref:Uncharacterized protein n=1 Tax=Manihot esculenta TaxID=3983 RepID=A0ACB7GYT5_MANES|nr:hypothetical protein MANES_10G076074v8 [Manihot esculenta]
MKLGDLDHCALSIYRPLFGWNYHLFPLCSSKIS